jgi:hypothetical protein
LPSATGASGVIRRQAIDLRAAVLIGEFDERALFAFTRCEPEDETKNTRQPLRTRHLHLFSASSPCPHPCLGAMAALSEPNPPKTGATYQTQFGGAPNKLLVSFRGT